MKQWPSLLFLAAIGCGGSSKRAEEPAPDPTAQAPAPPARPLRNFSCAEAQVNVAAFTRQVSRTLAATLGAHCTQDGWAPEVINCFASTQSGPDLNLCTALLTPEQQRAFETQNVADAVDPDAPPDPACAVLTGTGPVPASSAPAAGAASSKPTPLPTLGLPRGGATPAPATAPAPAPVASPARRIIAPKEMEALRAEGDPKIAPDAAEARLVERCNVARVIASFKLCVDVTGTPIVVDLLRSSRMPAYDGKLITAMRTWRYKPYLFEGKPTEVCTAVTFIFALQ
jgi:hypothetical protein